MAADLKTDLNLTDYSSYLLLLLRKRTDKFISNYRNSGNDVCKFCLLIS